MHLTAMLNEPIIKVVEVGNKPRIYQLVVRSAFELSLGVSSIHSGDFRA